MGEIVFEEWHKWFAIIAGDILLLAALFGLGRRAVTGTIKAVLKEELKEVKDHAKSTDEKVDKLIQDGEQRDAKLEGVADTVGKIVYQVEPNKGGSLRDSVVRTETAVKELEGKIDDKLEVLGGKLDDTRERVANVEGQIRDR